MLRRILAALIADEAGAKRSADGAGRILRMIPLDPQPELSTLDRLDGRGPIESTADPVRTSHTAGVVGPLCAVIACPNPPVTSIHGWSLCSTHRSVYGVSSK